MKIPIHLIRQYSYCPRIAYFHEFSNLSVTQFVPRVRQGLEAHQSAIEKIKYRHIKEKSDTFYSEYRLYHEDMDFFGKVDAFIEKGSEVIPIEFKLSSNSVHRGSVLQLIAYGVLLERIFSKKFNYGIIAIHNTRKLRIIRNQKETQCELFRTVNEIKKLVKNEVIPHSSADIGQCACCEFLHLCNDRGF